MLRSRTRDACHDVDLNRFSRIIVSQIPFDSAQGRLSVAFGVGMTRLEDCVGTDKPRLKKMKQARCRSGPVAEPVRNWGTLPA